MKSDKFEKIFGNYVLEAKISNDKLLAYLEIKYQKKSTNSVEDIVKQLEMFPTVYDINDFLNQCGIVYGVDDLVIDDVVRNKKLSKVVIATGNKPTQGTDAKITYNYDFSKNIKLIQDIDGNIDFKNLNWFSQVKKNDIIATKIPAQKGIDGMAVTGEVIVSKEGKDEQFKFGKNISLSYDFMNIYSMIDGILEISDGKIFVNEVMLIRGDIDTSVGNIDFIGDLIVTGDVKAGYVINVGGSMQVGGVLEASNITVKKDLIVKGGIQGSETTRILVGGSVICKFIENANVRATEDISTEFIIHSNVYASENLLLNNGRSMIVGGEVISKGSISVNMVGSSMGTKTSVIVGADLEKDAMLEEKKIKSDELNIKLKKLIPIIEMGKQMLSRGTMDNIRKISFAKSLKEYNEILNELKFIQEDIEELEVERDSRRDSYLIINDKIYPGVKISILNNIRYIKDFTSNCKIYLKGNEIAIER